MGQSFFWYELLTTDPAAAADFYADVVGWRPQSYDDTGAYTVLHAGQRGIGGIMKQPETHRATGAPPCWLGYIHSPDVDADTAAIMQAGGIVHEPPFDVPDVGRLAAVADPQGAVFMLMTPQGRERPPVAPMTPGHVGWHELYANDWSSAFDFYAGQFGWIKTEAMDMGPMGTYQLFATDGESCGAMMNRPEGVPAPVWQFYFIVPAIDAAAARVIERGGQILMGTHQVPGGNWITVCSDPQGAVFALVGPER
ncbi:VOC family protein [Iodidimonas sp. SYSU 1G8]|uniref:VOC family protein n=1 Tax=Iodidimonas sp. SYSU 1G8 TaxID=3133967 RepID=UPI0031FF12AF